MRTNLNCREKNAFLSLRQSFLKNFLKFLPDAARGIPRPLAQKIKFPQTHWKPVSLSSTRTRAVLECGKRSSLDLCSQARRGGGLHPPSPSLRKLSRLGVPLVFASLGMADTIRRNDPVPIHSSCSGEMMMRGTIFWDSDGSFKRREWSFGTREFSSRASGQTTFSPLAGYLDPFLCSVSVTSRLRVGFEFPSSICTSIALRAAQAPGSRSPSHSAPIRTRSSLVTW